MSKFVPRWIWMVWKKYADPAYQNASPAMCDEGGLEAMLRGIMPEVKGAEHTRFRIESLDIEFAWNGTSEELERTKQP